jgi:hypothetical protein
MPAYTARLEAAPRLLSLLALLLPMPMPMQIVAEQQLLALLASSKQRHDSYLSSPS